MYMILMPLLKNSKSKGIQYYGWRSLDRDTRLLDRDTRLLDRAQALECYVQTSYSLGHLHITASHTDGDLDPLRPHVQGVI